MTLHPIFQNILRPYFTQGEMLDATFNGPIPANRLLSDDERDLPAVVSVESYSLMPTDELKFEIKCDRWNLSTRHGLLRNAIQRVRFMRSEGARVEVARNGAVSLAQQCLRMRSRIGAMEAELAGRSAPVLQMAAE